MKTKSWLRLYHEFADDPKIQMLAFEDQRHYVMVLCLKGRGVIDSNTPTAEYRERMIAKALGLDPLTSREVKFRLMEPGLIDEQWQPVKWADRQFESDTSTTRVQKYRDKRKRFGNVSPRQEPEPEGQLMERTGNVSVTAQIRADQSRSEQRENFPIGNSLSEQSAPPRAIPSGSHGAQEQEKAPKGKKSKKLPPAPTQYDEAERRAFWGSCAINSVIRGCSLLGITQCRVDRFEQLPSSVRLVMPDKVRSLIEQCIDWERTPATKSFSVIGNHLEQEITIELRAFQPPSMAERSSALAGVSVSDQA